MAMYMITRFCFLFLIAASYSCESPQNASAAKDREMFPEELVSFVPSEYNPVFSAGPADAWDKKIRERGFILYEDSVYKLWYTGFSSDDDNGTKYLGYATSPDGIRWKRFEGNPVFSEKWTEDMFVFRDSGKYYMYAEGVNDVAHYLVSDDGIKWEEKGDLIILKTNGDTIPGPYGTPVVYVQDGKWHLFYERNDEGIWLATSTDKRIWKNVQDEAVLKPGPEKFDLGAVAADQVIKYKERYYMLYHANADPMWTSKPSPWSSDIAVSEDLIHWKKYSGNPITDGDHSSPVFVFDGQKFILYTMHPDVWLYLPGNRTN
jgi:beta-1,2-mannobiose phosphorylase / 1,2-beta-oligomannan phosphorylase